ncbi:MAG: trigger factor [Vicinamibacterales bacterium]
MKSDLIDVSPTQKQLVFEVPSARVDQEIARVTRDYGKSVRIPGFRPGKAPEKVVRQRYRDQILHDVLHELVPKTLDEALRERALEPVDTPNIRDVVLKEGAPLTFTAAFETVPPLSALNYESVSLRRSPVAITDEAISAMLERLRERHARFEPIEGRGASDGDIVTMDVKRRGLPRPGVPEARVIEPDSHDDVSVEIGDTINPPGFDAEILGMQAGDTRTFPIAFPDDYQAEELQGTLVEYEVTAKGLKRKVLPAVDDEFAKDLGDFSSLDQLRERIRTDMGQEATRAREREIRSDLLRQLAGTVTFDVPEPLVERELERRLQDFVGRLVDSGVDPNQANINWQEYRESQREPAVDTVKAVLVLDDVARREQIAVTEDELTAEVARLADRTGRSPAAVKARLEKEGGLSRLISGMRRDKTVEFLLSRVTIVTV